ncbi:MAG: hypothetical protein KME16_23520 [Scytolyngbya sp. HA4215-MV1]|nr:hypothetical protein [Scytolyngbya sp. HA4215-MV1]
MPSITLLILGMNLELYEVKLRSYSYYYSAPPFYDIALAAGGIDEGAPGG